MMNECTNPNCVSMTPYFSIILPIYNVESWLEQCIESVLNQSFRSYELILVDDGATDGSPAICDRYAAQYNQIRVIHKRNGGLSSARNAGTQIARGEYIWWVDADDWIEPDALTVLYQASHEDVPDMVKFNFFRAGQQRREIRCAVKPGLYHADDAMETLRDQAFFFAGRFSLSAWGNIYKTAFLREKALTFVSERVIGSEDYLFNLSALAVAEKVRVIEAALYNYRLREGSLTQRYRKDLPQKYTELHRQLCAYYRQMGVYEQYEGRICNFYVWHLLHGTCFANEYRITAEHSRQEGRKNVCRFLRSSDLQYAAAQCDQRLFTKKQRIQLWAMRMKIEPLFYWLFVVKPQHRKEIHHENSD